MKTNRLVLLIIISAMSLSSCVSKKKFVEMESSKLRAEQRVRELTGENEAKASRIGTMIADFEKMKQELMGSNAKKDQLISDLAAKINALNSNVKEKDATIEEKLYAFEFEKRQMKEALRKSRDSVSVMQNKNSSLSGEVNSLKSDLSSLRFDYDRQKDDMQRLRAQATLNDRKYEEQAARLARLDDEIRKLKAAMQEKDDTIERLKNNVALLKKELAK